MVFLYDVGIDMEVVPFHYVWCEHVGYLFITRKTLLLCMHRLKFISRRVSWALNCGLYCMVFGGMATIECMSLCCIWGEFSLWLITLIVIVWLFSLEAILAQLTTSMVE